MTRSAWKHSCRAATALALVATLSASDCGDGRVLNSVEIRAVTH